MGEASYGAESVNSEIEVTIAADVTALVELDRVKSALDISGSDDDEELLATIDDATSVIAARCLRSLKRETVRETFYADSRGGGAEKLILSRYPVASVASVAIDDVAISSSEYRTARGILYRLTSSGDPAVWRFWRSLVVIYVAGYLLPGQENRDLPAALESACLSLVSAYWSARGRDPTLIQEENEGVARFRYWVGAIGEADDLPPDVIAKIAPYTKGMRR